MNKITSKIVFILESGHCWTSPHLQSAGHLKGERGMPRLCCCQHASVTSSVHQKWHQPTGNVLVALWYLGENAVAEAIIIIEFLPKYQNPKCHSVMISVSVLTDVV